MGKKSHIYKSSVYRGHSYENQEEDNGMGCMVFLLTKVRVKAKRIMAYCMMGYKNPLCADMMNIALTVSENSKASRKAQ